MILPFRPFRPRSLCSFCSLLSFCLCLAHENFPPPFPFFLTERTISPPQRLPTSPYLLFHLDFSSVRSVFSSLSPRRPLKHSLCPLFLAVRGGSSFDPPDKRVPIGYVSVRKPASFLFPPFPTPHNFTLSFFHLRSHSLSLSLSLFLRFYSASSIQPHATPLNRSGAAVAREMTSREMEKRENREREREREREKRVERRKPRARGGEKRKGRVSNGGERMAMAIRRPIHGILKGIIPGQCSRRTARSAPRREIK